MGGRTQRHPDQGAFGPGSAQPPANMADFDTYVRAVMERYRGRIDGYEVWNEPGSPQFFTGTPAQMGQMTAIVARAADDIDPAAYVASAGFQTNRPELYEGFIPSISPICVAAAGRSMWCRRISIRVAGARSHGWTRSDG